MSSTPPISGRLQRPLDRSPLAPAPAAQAAAIGTPLTTILVGGTVVWFLFGILGAWAYDQFGRKPDQAAEPTVSIASENPTEGALAALSEAELDPLRTRLGELSEQVGDFEKQLADAPPPAVTEPADLAPIRQRLDDVARSVDTIDPLSKQLQTINTRMEGLETSVNSLKGDLGSLQAKSTGPEQGKMQESEVVTPPSAIPTSTPALAIAAPEALKPDPVASAKPEQAKETKMEIVALPPATATGAPAPAVAVPDVVQPDAAALPLENPTVNAEPAAFSEGVKLFKAQKYQDAYKAFEKLATTAPNDARVWYFAALSFGYATDDFTETSQTASLLKKGLECERAGTPKTAEIDAAVRDLNTANGKEWLAFKRKAGLK